MRVIQSLFRLPLSWRLLGNPPVWVFIVAIVFLYVPILLIRVIVYAKRSLYGLFGPFIAWWAGEFLWGIFFACSSYILRHSKEKLPSWSGNIIFHLSAFTTGYTLGILNRVRAFHDAKTTYEVAFFNQWDQGFHDWLVFGLVLYLCIASIPLLFVPGNWRVQLCKVGMLVTLLGFGVCWKLDRFGDETRFVSPMPQ